MAQVQLGSVFLGWLLPPTTRQRCWCGASAVYAREVPVRPTEYLTSQYCEPHWRLWQSLLGDGDRVRLVRDAVSDSDRDRPGRQRGRA